MNIVGQDHVAQRFARSLSEGRLASTYLFVGPGGVGKRLFARWLAQCLFCSETPEHDLQACGRCQSCTLLAAGNHPDLLEVGLKKDKRTLAIDQFVGDKEHRHRQGLCHDISLKPYLANRRVAIIDAADTFSSEVGNCLLKTLEEPPPRSLLILVGSSEAKQLATIRSRSQIVRFAPLPSSELERLLMEQELVDSPEVARQLAELAGGSLDQARTMADQTLWELYKEAVALLSGKVIDSVTLAERVHQYANSAGKEAALRRTALISVLGLVSSHFRRQLRANPDGPQALSYAACIDRCLDAEYQVDRNVHLQTVVQSWADDLARL